MFWVRFPNGQCVQYNRATYGIRSPDGYTDILTEKGGFWIAQVPNTCIIEAEYACRVWNPLDTNPKDTDTAKELRAIKRKLGKVK